LLPPKLAYNIILIIFGINVLNLLILFEYDTFKECGRSNDGGSIYVKNNGENFVIVNSESIKSHTESSKGLFLYTEINTILKYNFVLYSTISESYYTGSGRWGTIYLGYGQIRIISTNSSNNVCYYMSSCYLVAINNGASSDLKYSMEDSYVHYCYVMNNYANNYICIYFNSYKHTCEECNIINNSQVSSSWGTFECESSSPTITINKCCLINNNAIGNGIYLFFVNTGTMYVKECTIQSGYKNNGALTSYSNKEISAGRKEFINCLNMWKIDDKLHKCSIYDNMLINNLYRLYLNKRFLI
jgi:hypothetical protein